MPPYREILCPLDLSDSSATLDAALSMARASGAGLHLLHVLDDLARQEDTARAAHIAWSEQFDRLSHGARQRLRQAAESQDASGVTMDVIVSGGKPYHVILKVAGDRDASLIVMGIHGLNPLARKFVGSTTLQVLRHARCPVLTVRPPEATS